MEFTENTIKCLLNESNLNLLDEETLQQLMPIALSHVCGKSNTKELTDIYGSKPEVIKTAHADILKLFIEAARNDTSSEKLSSLLMCTTLIKAHVDKICEFYETHKEILIETLETTGNCLPHIIDVDWQLDYCIKSNTSFPDGTLRYTVSLSTMKHGSVENVKFTCTIQELQELVQKMKDAVRHTEKLTNL